MTIGSVLDVFLSAEQKGDSEPDRSRIGSGLVIHSEVVQLDDQAAALLRSTAVPAARLELRDGSGPAQPVARIRPGLLGSAETAKIVAEQLDGLELLPVDGDLVFLELPAGNGRPGGGDDDGDCPPVGDPWYCRFICTSACSDC